MTNSSKLLHNNKQMQQLLVSNPLVFMGEPIGEFLLPEPVLQTLQQLRNDVALEKLSYSPDVTSPSYAIEVVQFMAVVDAKLAVYEELITLHYANLERLNPQSGE